MSHIFDDKDDAPVHEKVSLLELDEIYRYARYVYYTLCGYRDECRNKAELRDQKKRLTKRCQQARFTPLERATCRQTVSDIFDDKHATRGEYRATIMDIARFYYWQTCGEIHVWTGAGAQATCNINSANAAIATPLKHALDFVRHHLCHHIDDKYDQDGCDAAVRQVFDSSVDVYLNGYGAANEQQQAAPSAARFGSDLPQYEEFAAVVRRWVNYNQDDVCASAARPRVTAPQSPNNGLEPTLLAKNLDAANNLIHVCKRQSTPAYGRLLLIGYAKCLKLTHDVARFGCIDGVKKMLDNINESTEDGGRYAQDFAKLQPIFYPTYRI